MSFQNSSVQLPIPSGDLTHKLTIQEDTEELKPKAVCKSPKKQPVYFAADHTMEYNCFSDIPDNDDYFNLKNFFTLASIQSLYFYLLGPLSIILIIPIFGKSIAHNLYFTSCHFKTLWNMIQFLLFMTVPIVYLTLSPENVLNIEVFMFMGGYMMLRSLDCVTLATMGPKKLKYFFNNALTEEELDNENTYSHFNQEKINAFIEEEIVATMERKDIDISLFKITFLTNLDKSLENTVNGLPSIKRINSKPKNEQSNITFFPNKYPVFNGCNVARMLIKWAYQSGLSLNILKMIAIFLAILYSLVPLLIRVFLKMPIIGISTLENIMILGLFFLNIHYYYKDAILGIFSLYEYGTFLNLMTQLTNLAAYKRDLKYESRKFFPTMDFFNPLTIKSWGILHTIFIDYGKKYKIRINCYLTLYMFANFLAIIFLIFSLYGMPQLFDWFKVTIVAYELFVFAILGMWILVKASAINDHFNIHRGHIKNNLDIVRNLCNEYTFYFEEEEIPTENEIFIEGVMRIKTYSEEMYEFHKKKKLDIEVKNKEPVLKEIRLDSLRKLANLLKINLQLLKYGLKIEPLTILGITVNTTLLNSLIVGIGSILLAVIQGVFQKFYDS